MNTIPFDYEKAKAGWPVVCANGSVPDKIYEWDAPGWDGRAHIIGRIGCNRYEWDTKGSHGKAAYNLRLKAPIKRKVWVDPYLDGTHRFYHSRDLADKCQDRDKHRIACVEFNPQPTPFNPYRAMAGDRVVLARNPGRSGRVICVNRVSYEGCSVVVLWPDQNALGEYEVNTANRPQDLRMEPRGDVGYLNVYEYSDTPVDGYVEVELELPPV